MTVLIYSVLAALLCGAASALGSTPVTLTVTPVSTGGFQYECTVQNTNGAASQPRLELFDFTLRFDSVPTVLALPQGWDYVTFGNQVDVFSTISGEPPLGLDIGPGSSLSGFTFQVNAAPSDVSFTVTFVDFTDRFQTPVVVQGSTRPKLIPLVTWLTPTPIPYGVALTATQLSATSPVAGNFTYSPSLGTLLNAGARLLSVRFTPQDAATYTATTATVTLDVLKVPGRVLLDRASLIQSYDGTPKAVTATTLPTGLSVGFTYNDSPAVPVAPGKYNVVGMITDLNYQGATNGTLTIVKAPPATSASLSGPLGANGWYTGAVLVTFTVTDSGGPSDIASTSYGVDGGSEIRYTTPFVVASDGIHTIQFSSVDNFGNVETPKAITVKIDQTPPTISVSGEILPPKHEEERRLVRIGISGKITDLTSGVDASSATFIVLDGDGIPQINGAFSLPANGTYSLTVSFKRKTDHEEEERRGKAYKVTVSAKDNAGNPASSSMVIDRERDDGDQERRGVQGRAF